MKIKHAWCIVSKQGNPIFFNSQYPIYSNKKVALYDCNYYTGGDKGAKIVRVSISKF